MIIVPIAIISWVTVTFLSEPEPLDKLETFYKRVQPGGWWGPVTSSFNHTLQPVTKGIFILWISGVLMIYGFTFGIGNLIDKDISDIEKRITYLNKKLIHGGSKSSSRAHGSSTASTGAGAYSYKMLVDVTT